MPPAVHFTYGFPEFRAVYRARRGGLRDPGRFARLASFLAVYLLIVCGWVLWTYGPRGLQYLLFPDVLKQMALWMGILVAAFLVAPYLFQEIFLRRAVRRAAAMNQPVAVTLNEGGIDVTGPAFTAAYRWDAIVRLHADREHLLLYISDIEAIPIPRRAFADVTTFEALVRYAREHVHG